LRRESLGILNADCNLVIETSALHEKPTSAGDVFGVRGALP
jgi:hypothetical protein